MVEPTSDSQFTAEAQRIRGLLDAEGRSETLLRLFDYLQLHSQDLRAPKEIEIAFEVFGKDTRFDTSQDAMVRIWVHRLRTRLEAIYREATGPRLAVLKGDYRLVLIDPPVSDVKQDEVPVTRSRGPLHWDFFSRCGMLGIAALLLLTIAGWGALFHFRDRESAAQGEAGSLFANTPARCGVPTVVAGDSYMFLQTRQDERSPRLVMRPDVNSAAELETAIAGTVVNGEEVVDRDVYYLSVSSAEGLWSLLGADTVVQGKGLPKQAVLPISKLNKLTLNRGNILYFGRLDQLGLLHDIVFEASRFTFDPLSDTLRAGDKRQFVAQLADNVDRDYRNPLKRPAFTHDYGYIAKIRKPDGCALLIVAGLQDAALPQAARIASDRAQMTALSHRSHGAPSFEALYEIRSLGALRYESRLLTAHALHAGR